MYMADTSVSYPHPSTAGAKAVNQEVDHKHLLAALGGVPEES